MSQRDDDQVYWENRKEDEKHAHKKLEREAEIAKGFSHNTDALYALYGYAKPGYSRSDEINSDEESMKFPEKLGREELVNEIKRQRDAALDKIQRCYKLDHEIKLRWIDSLLDIDLFQCEATRKIQGLRDRVKDYRDGFPYYFGYGNLSSAELLRSDLGLTKHELWQLEQLCSTYQNKFGSSNENEVKVVSAQKDVPHVEENSIKAQPNVKQPEFDLIRHLLDKYSQTTKNILDLLKKG